LSFHVKIVVFNLLIADIDLFDYELEI